MVLSLAAGFIIFLLPFEMPEIISGTIGYMAGMNAPVAMFSLGTYLAQVSLSDLLRDKTAYLSAAVRLVVVPVLTALLLCLVPDGYEMLATALIIVAATPVGSNVAIFAQIHNKNYKQAVQKCVPQHRSEHSYHALWWCRLLSGSGRLCKISPERSPFGIFDFGCEKNFIYFF